MNKDLIKLRDCFRELADIIDEIVVLGTKETEGEDIKKDMENVMGRYILKAMELKTIENNM
ncbi:hypothetical protein FDB52_05720 [Clostridium botulinum]|uniref:hypothetical protein n=1 Tax=Clostridium botulinum TaxID=1491 RepID=UPI00036EF639|nr:hypothetical protein [Clostridium botulinum]NFL86239.1 hypothetical protein [Clostridium botulinum]NFN17843.1 hypothetical protein [Clostridium botulinum]NFN48053.1 hypothetical protein [Clostridium botulinum]NFO19686.1 hypothetical protein [Clostridium botulinum]